jgi:hypothetical protein
MIALIVIWIGLLAICALIGSHVLNLLALQKSLNRCFATASGHVFILNTWVGALTIAALLLYLSIFLPLSIAVVVPVIGILVTCALLKSAIRSDIQPRWRALSRAWQLAAVSIFGLMALVATMQINLYDAGLYHFQVIRWLSQFGTVPGFALLHNRFGFSSTWFTLAAPFNTGILEARINSLTGGFAFSLIILHATICLQNMFPVKASSKSQVADWFLFGAMMICLPFLAKSWFIASASPDVPTIFLTIEIVWLILAIENSDYGIEITSHSWVEKADVTDAAIVEKKRLWVSHEQSRLAIAPLLLAIGTMTIKLSALPLVVVVFGYYCTKANYLERDYLWKYLARAVWVVSVVIVPFLLLNILSSGCPLYPSSTLCMPFPWSVGPEEAHQNSQIILSWARWLGDAPADANNYNWIIPWLTKRTEAVILLVASLVAAVGLWFAPEAAVVRGKTFVSILAAIGIAFMLYKAPDPRFGLGYLAMLPSFAIALMASSQLALAIGGLVILSTAFVVAAIGPAIQNLGLLYLVELLLYLGCVLTLAPLGYENLTRQGRRNFKIGSLWTLLLVITVYPTLGYIKNPSLSLERFILPPQMPSLNPSELTEHQATNFTYDIPSNDRCYAAPIPCTPHLTHKDVVLRNKDIGLRGGFQRSSD